MSKKNKKQVDNGITAYRMVIVLIIVFLVGAYGIAKLTSGNSVDEVLRESDSKTVQLAECLAEKGVKMYGAYWCSHCQAQKKDFGTAFEKIDYVECAIQGNPRAQTQACEDAGIQSYPTWVFADGSQETGEQSFEDLARRSGCEWSEE